jgi:hypothetical protein
MVDEKRLGPRITQQSVPDISLLLEAFANKLTAPKGFKRHCALSFISLITVISSMDETNTDSDGTGKVIDLSHHLSSEARVRVANPLKDIIRVISECTVTNLISMANGNLPIIIATKCN